MRRVAIANPALLGDVLFSSRLCVALNRSDSALEIVFIAKPPADQLARRFMGISEVLPFKKRGADRGLGGVRRLAEKLRLLEVDTLISLHRGWRMAFLAKRLGGTVRTLGYAGLFGRAYDEVVPFDPAATYFAREEAFLRVLGVDAAGAKMSLRAPTRSQRRGILLAPGASMFSKRWPLESFQQLARRLIEKDFPVRLTGGPAEMALCAEIAGAAPGVDNQCGESLEAAAEAVAQSQVVVANDSGIAHLARAVKTPTLILFGPTSPAVHDVAGERTLLLSQPISCAPCSPHGEPRCPRGHHRCMEELTVSRVLTQVADLLRAS
jgi:heptosyltransferase-2